MYHEQRNFEADARFVEAGGLKNWGCTAMVVGICLLGILFVVVRLLLLKLISDPVASGITLLFIIGIAAGATSFLIRRRRRLLATQERIWQEAMAGNSQNKEGASQQDEA